jgi:hypothetical protein
MKRTEARKLSTGYETFRARKQEAFDKEMSQNITTNDKKVLEFLNHLNAMRQASPRYTNTKISNLGEESSLERKSPREKEVAKFQKSVSSSRHTSLPRNRKAKLSIHNYQ